MVQFLNVLNFNICSSLVELSVKVFVKFDSWQTFELMLRFLVLLIIDKSINVMKYRRKFDASIPNALLMYIIYTFQLVGN